MEEVVVREVGEVVLEHELVDEEVVVKEVGVVVLAEEKVGWRRRRWHRSVRFRPGFEPCGSRVLKSPGYQRGEVHQLFRGMTPWTRPGVSLSRSLSLCLSLSLPLLLSISLYLSLSRSIFLCVPPSV